MGLKARSSSKSSAAKVGNRVSKPSKGLFKKGFEGAREAAIQQEERRKMMGKKLFEFFLKGNNDEAEIIFLNEEPINCEVHQVKGYRNGKEFYESVVCTADSDEGCTLCEDGDRPTYRGAFLVIDLREYEVTVNGKKETREGAIRLWLVGTKIASQLDRISQKRGLMGSIHTVIRLGTGTSTTYTFEQGESIEVTDEEILNLLPEALKESYGNGTEKEIDNLIEEQLMLRAGAEIEESDDELESKNRKNLVPADDEEDDDDNEDEAPPRRRSIGSARPALRKSDAKKPQPKAKGLFKSKR